MSNNQPFNGKSWTHKHFDGVEWTHPNGYVCNVMAYSERPMDIGSGFGHPEGGPIPPQYFQGNPRPPKKHTGLKVLGVIGAVLIVAGLIGAALSDRPAGNAVDLYPSETATPTGSAAQTITPTAPAPVKPKPVEQAPSRMPEDGTLLVGKDVTPGMYQTRVVADDYMPLCYWARLKSVDGDLDSIIDNNSVMNAGALVTLQIKATDYAVEINCSGAKWTRIGG